MSAPPARRGQVLAFDDHVGLGRVGDGVGAWPFHCTVIADGSRTIAVGTPVTFTLRPAHAGMLEAVEVRPTG